MRDFASQEDIEKIENEVQECIDTNYMTDAQMMKCTADGTEKFNKEIQKTLKAAKNHLSQSQYKQLLISQTKWEDFMKEHGKLLDQTYRKPNPSDLARLCAANDVYEYTKQRISDLSGFLALLLFFKKNGLIVDGMDIVPFDY